MYIYIKTYFVPKGEPTVMFSMFYEKSMHGTSLIVCMKLQQHKG